MTKLAKKIKDLRLALNLKQRELADLLGGGVLQSTVSQWENGKQEPNSTNNARLAALAEVPFEDWLNIPRVGHVEAHTRRVPLVGTLQAGDWREAIETYDDEEVVSLVPDLIEGRPTRKMNIQAFRLAGDSVNKLYPDGSIVYAASPMSFREPKSGDRVVVIRKDVHGLVEATVKELVVEANGEKWLWPRSHNPKHQAPLPYVEGSDGSDIVVSGIVIASFVLEEDRRQ